MALHKFKVGQIVDLIPSRREANVPGDNDTIQRLLPEDGGDLQYRVKYVRDGHERVVHESQLADPAPATHREIGPSRHMP